MVNGIQLPYDRMGQQRRAHVRRWFQRRYNRFRQAGYTDEEALWAADNGMLLKDEKTKDLLENRRGMVELYISFGLTRDEAEERAAGEMMDIIRRAGEEWRGPVVFYQGSPP